MRASFKRPRVESSLGVAPPPPPPLPSSSSGDPTTDAYVDSTVVADPPPYTLDDSSIRHMLDTVTTIQAAHGQLLVDTLMELQVLHVELASFKRSPPPPPFDDAS